MLRIKRRLVAKGDDLSSRWGLMQDFGNEVNSIGYEYRPFSQNSNSFAGGALQRTGFLGPGNEFPERFDRQLALDPASGETKSFYVPGFEAPFAKVTTMIEADRAEIISRALRFRLGRVRYLAAVSALFLGLAQISDSRADSASCLTKVSSFVTELDELLSKEKNWNTPYFDLIDRYFPLRDCEVETLLEVVRGSHFIRSISYRSRTNEYFVFFASEDADAGFAYLVSEKKSRAASAGLSHK